jgi:hypothetical protein
LRSRNIIGRECPDIHEHRDIRGEAQHVPEYFLNVKSNLSIATTVLQPMAILTENRRWMSSVESCTNDKPQV